MKAVYEMPNVCFEEFAAGSAVAAGACTSETYIDFSCLWGPNTDNTNVLYADTVGGCDNEAGYIGYGTGTNQVIGARLESGNNSGSTDYLQMSSSGNWLTVTVKSAYQSVVQGFLYITMTGSNNGPQGQNPNQTSSTSTGCTDGWSRITYNDSPYMTYDTDKCSHDNEGSHIQFAPVVGIVSVGSV